MSFENIFPNLKTVIIKLSLKIMLNIKFHISLLIKETLIAMNENNIDQDFYDLKELIRTVFCY